MHTALMAFLLLCLPGPRNGNAVQEQSDEQLIRGVVTDYIAGWREGDVKKLSRVLAPKGTVMWITGEAGTESLSSMTFGDILKRRKPQKEYGLRSEILHLDVIDGKLAVKIFVVR